MKDESYKPLGRSPFPLEVEQPKNQVFQVIRHTEIEEPTIKDYGTDGVTSKPGHS